MFVQLGTCYCDHKSIMTYSEVRVYCYDCVISTCTHLCVVQLLEHLTEVKLNNTFALLTMEASKKPQYIRDFIVYVQKMVLTTQQFTCHVLVLI